MFDPAPKKPGEQTPRFRYPEELTPTEIEQTKRVLDVDGEAYLLWLAGEGPDPVPARVLRLTQRFDWAVRRYGVAGGTAGGRALYALLRSMQTAELPGPDYETMFPPVLRYWFRRVPGQNLWLFYSFDDEQRTAVGLTRSPPVPYDD